MRQFHLTSSQKKSNLWIGGLTAAGLLIIAAVLGQVAANGETGANLMLAVIGLTLGVLVRNSTKRGWTYAMADQSPTVAIKWTAKRRLGVIGRALTMLVAGGLIIGGLGGLASGDIALSLFMALAVLVITAGGIVAGLRYGWNEAQSSLETITTARATP